MPRRLEKLVLGSPRSSPWTDYMVREISEDFLGGQLASCVDRARILLDDFTSQQVLEANYALNDALDMFIEETVERAKSYETGRLDELTPDFYERDREDAFLILSALQHVLPDYKAQYRPRTSGGSEDGGHSVLSFEPFGIEPGRTDASILYLASWALKEAFAATQILMESEAYKRLGLDVNFEQQINEVVLECENENEKLVGAALSSAQTAGKRAMLALEAVMVAELMHHEGKIQLWADERLKRAHKDAISANAKRAVAARHGPSIELKKLARELYELGSFKSLRQAARCIAPRIMAKAKEMGYRLSEDRIEKTIAEWLTEKR